MTTVELAEKFLDYCRDHPEYRFWQAVGNFTKWPFVLVGLAVDLRRERDTYYISNEEAILEE